MKNNRSDKYVVEVSERLKMKKISFYKIAQILDEPKSTILNLFSGQSKYSAKKVNSIMDRITSYLNELEGIQMEEEVKSDIKIPGKSDCPEIFENYDLYIRLFELGLNARTFNPEEKLRFAIWHRTLTAFKGKEKQEDS